MVRPASWIIREKTGRVLFETFNPNIAASLNNDKYAAVPVVEFRAELDNKIKSEVSQ